MSKTYNGHKNWNYWNVSLWISGDEGIYRLAKDLIRQYQTKDQAARAMVQALPAQTPDGANYTLSAVRAALVGM